MSEIVVLFRCVTCMQHLQTESGVPVACPHTEVTVRARHPNETLTRWMERVVKVKVAQSHRLASPQCTSLIVDLALPVPAGDNPRVGMASRGG